MSYAHHDARFASWLHRRIEGYRPPSGTLPGDRRRRPLAPVFRDREELAASAALGERLHNALIESENLIVLCSPAAARSRWVAEEIRVFRDKHGADRIFAVILDGEPGGGAGLECFPAPLTEPDQPGGPPREPVAADLRKQGDGRQRGFLKLVAGLLNIPLDHLIDREQMRRQRRLAIIAGATSLGMVITLGLAFYADSQRRLAEENARTAEATVDFLVGTFRLADPATENPRTISALTILARGADRIARDLGGEPAIRARLHGAIGRVYNNLGLYERARDILTLADADATASGTRDRRRRIGDGIERALSLAHLGALDDALALLDELRRDLTHFSGPDGPYVAREHEVRALALTGKADMPAALAEYQAARAAYLALENDRRQELAGLDNKMGVILVTLGRHEEAMIVLERAVASCRLLHGENHIDTARALNNLALAALESGDLVRAGEAITAATAVYDKVLDPTNPSRATGHVMQGRILEAQGNYGEALAAFEAARAGYAAAYPNGHYLIGYAEVYAATALAKIGRVDEALARLDDAHAEYDRSYGGLHANHGDLEINRAMILADAGRKDEAATACRAGRDILLRTLGPDSEVAAPLVALCSSRNLLDE